MRVDVLWKGSLPTKVYLDERGSDCDMKPRSGQFMIYGKRTPKGIRVSECGGSHLVTSSDADIYRGHHVGFYVEALGTGFGIMLVLALTILTQAWLRKWRYLALSPDYPKGQRTFLIDSSLLIAIILLTTLTGYIVIGRNLGTFIACAS